MLDPALELLLRGALALLFAATALHKARDPEGFRASVEGYALLPERLCGGVAGALTGGEAALAAALLLPASLGVRGPALVAAAALLGLYAAAIAVNLARGRRDIDCGCAGPAARQPLSGWLVARNALLAALALACLRGAALRPLVWVDAVTVSGGIALLAATWSAAHGLLAHATALGRLREPT
jgi:hypothetical protein